MAECKEPDWLEDDTPGGVITIYDMDIEDIMEDVQRALNEIGAKVKITLKAFNNERVDFLFEKVE